MEKNEFASIKIGLASPEMIRNWSYGEVTTPETVNYRTLKPMPGGLFCERIFGPTKDGACSCGNYKKVHTLGGEKIICPKCGVEVTTKKVRRERMGHIDLASPVSHIWYFKGAPSKLATVLDIKVKDLEQVIYYAENVVIEAPENSEYYPGRVLNEKECADALLSYENEVRVGMGAEAVRELLRRIGLEPAEYARREELEKIEPDSRTDEEKEELDALCRLGVERLAASIREELVNATAANKTKLIKRLEVIENFRKSGNRLDWMILDVVPVLPPDLRPMVQLDGGRFASSDLNELYRRVINRNNRLKKLIELKTPEIVIRNEKRMLQEAVDALIDNGKRGKPVTGPNNRTLKSLSEMLRGKQGRFRQNLLGKRVDYSGRSVIVVGPSLKIYQCGLPKEMALELFKPFVVKRLVEMNCATSVKDAQRKIDRAQTSNDEVWDALEIVIKEHPVLLNRAPTLHRLSIQAFEPVLVEGRAIKLHPLVCTAFNADFDGDQMPVHVPLSAEAQAEARFLMLSANNLLKPVDGRAVTVPTQDMILGSYYLTIVKPEEAGCGNIYRDYDEAVMAYSNGYLGLHAPIAVTVTGENGGRGVIGLTGAPGARTVNTGSDAVTLGRLMFNSNIPQDLGFVDRTDPARKYDLEIAQIVTKKELGQIINNCIRKHTSAITAKMLDAIKEMGYRYSTRASFSISVYDMTIPKEKKALIAEAESKVAKLQKDFNRGKLAENERYESVIRVWNKTTDDVTKALQAGFSTYNPIKIMADSGARGSMTQMRQLAGMRGPMFATSGKTMEIPIKSNFREGMKIFEYFMGARSSRKSLSDTALRTADSGYLTRRLVDVSQEIIVREEKCDTEKGAWISAIFENDREFTLYSFSSGDKLADSYAFEDIHDPRDGRLIVAAKAKITKKTAERLAEAFAGSDAEIKIIAKSLETLEDRLLGRFTMGEITDPETGAVIAGDDEMLNEKQVAAIIEAGIAKVKIRTVIHCHARYGVCAHCYGSDLANGKKINIGEAVGIIAAQSIGEPGTQLTMRTFHTGGVAGSDITQGLPRVEELFEARTPKKPAVLAKAAGVVSIETISTDSGPVDVVTLTTDELGGSARYQIPFGRRLIVTDGQTVEQGQPLTEGSMAPAEIMAYRSPDEVYSYIITEVQKVYRAQSVNINDKHIEVIARQMTRKLKITDSGDTDLLPESVVSVNEFEDVNREIARRNAAGEVNQVGEPLRAAEAKALLLGITKAALATESFMSAASFQETTKVLTDAAIKGKIDNLLGLKENVIIGKLIPAGTGMACYRNVDVVASSELEGEPAAGE
ncbi:MAG: DNA-directed RNA polymerase subunit beta' [Clostridia bacterium]|nr:DNA-directed RNA polymerase subunit beta' [Clostridia bacterium]